ncbi:exported hypothetical protein [Bosea sp. EC-HK365B]|nr:exported hypothetical protein [Bosea sp. 21B]VVT62306.1 exported hypothetical protein [Bosea sp. EC-HK365B]
MPSVLAVRPVAASGAGAMVWAGAAVAAASQRPRAMIEWVPNADDVCGMVLSSSIAVQTSVLPGLRAMLAALV